LSNPHAPIRRIGFIGLGKMGQPMARRLIAAGFKVHGYDLSEAARAAAIESGAKASASLGAVMAKADVIITMLPNSDAVETVALGGADSIARLAAPGTLLIDMSSAAPHRTRRLGEALGEHGITMVDAPVSGGVLRAADGALTIMLGGSEDAVARARPVLEHLGSRLFETGGLGSGHAMKALNNYVSAAGLTAACEALQIGAQFGLDPALMIDILNVSTGRNNSTENKIKQFVLSSSFDGGFGLGLMAKDLATAAALADELAMRSPFCHEAARLWGEALASLGPAVDHTEIDTFLRRV
jgi:3-hydroxyisobutyrate dehydrogenase